MIIDTGIDIENNEFFINVKNSMNDTIQMELELSNYLKKHLCPKYKVFMFLCDTFWNDYTKITAYRGLWKQNFIKENFGHYSNNTEKAFFNLDHTKVMFASCFELSLIDLSVAINRAATLNVGHSFIFFSENELNISTDEIFNALNILDEKKIGNDWNNLINFLHKHKCIPVQKWQGGNEISLRLFLIDGEIPIL